MSFIGFIFDQRCIKIKRNIIYGMVNTHWNQYYCNSHGAERKRWREDILYVMHIYYHIHIYRKKKVSVMCKCLQFILLWAHALPNSKSKNAKYQLWKQVSMLISFINEILQKLTLLLRSPSPLYFTLHFSPFNASIRLNFQHTFFEPIP